MKTSDRKHSISNSFRHEPVMVKEATEYLDPAPGKFIVDGTVDGGGHAAAILERLNHSGTFLGIDWDSTILESTARALHDYASAELTLVWAHDNYANIGRILRARSLPKPDGILLDLGFSTLQIESSGRGFSFLKDEPLLMTYSDGFAPVRQILREASAEELTRIIRTYGEERFAGPVARAIKERGRKKPIATSGDLALVVKEALPKGYERGRIHPATRTFQALRIYANHELENLETLLASLPDILVHAGRIVVLSFHSLEDRIVKNYFRDFEKEGRFTILTKKPISPTEEEIARNPKSRSVKLRAACFEAPVRRERKSAAYAPP